MIYGVAGKVSIKPKKGWKIKAIKASYLNSNYRIAYKKMKNNRAIPAKTKYLVVVLKNKKTKVIQHIELSAKTD